MNASDILKLKRESHKNSCTHHAIPITPVTAPINYNANQAVNKSNIIYILNGDDSFTVADDSTKVYTILNRKFSLYRNSSLGTTGKYILYVNFIYETDMLDFYLNIKINDKVVYRIRYVTTYPNINKVQTPLLNKLNDIIIIDLYNTTLNIVLENDNESGYFKLYNNSYYTINNL